MVLIIFPPQKSRLPQTIETKLIDYKDTGRFSRIVIDYIRGSALKEFYRHTVNLEGIQEAINDRNAFLTDRKLLVEQLKIQYSALPVSEKVDQNIAALLSNNTYTICTAHQPNIFTGHLYFIYKIIHVIKLAAQLNDQLPGNSFVPVFYMGSEDADLEELGHIFLFGSRYEWKTKQIGAVGRMVVDKELLSLIDIISGQIKVLPFGKQIMDTIQNCYTKGSSIEQATFKFVHHLFAEYGLLVLLPDNPELKRAMLPLFEKDLFSHEPADMVNKISAKLEKEYPVQAHARDINLFYLKDNLRNRIISKNGVYMVAETSISFTADELKKELMNHPERFSPNVILRGLYQEMILPNIAFIGGGGELAYWLQLKGLFDANKVPFPMLVLRNSFVYIEEKVSILMSKNSLLPEKIFTTIPDLMKDVISKHSSLNLSLDEQKEKLLKLYGEIQSIATAIDPSLREHVLSLSAKVFKTIVVLEKKMLKDDRKKFEAEERQLAKIYSYLFPGNNLQERTDNFLPYYAKYGKDFIRQIFDASSGLEQKFTIIVNR